MPDTKSPDDVLKKKLAVFMYAFENVFKTDWEYSKSVLGIDDGPVSSDFLRRGEYTDWASHEALISAYQDLSQEMARQKIGEKFLH